MELRLLGPFEVVEDGRALVLGGPKQRAVLAMLALEAGRVVSRDRIIDGVWGESAADTAVATLQVYVSNLRKVLEPAKGEHQVLVGRRPGYVLQVDPDQVDALRFERLVGQARKQLADERYEGAARDFGAALALWRGQPLADLDAADFAGPELTRLHEMRLGAVEDRAEAELACGRHAAAVAGLELLVTENPLRERLWGQLMLALYRSGQQAEALSTYARARDTLVDEYGIDPGPDLRELERRILNQDPDLAPPPGTARATVKLPAPSHPVIGRAADLAAVSAALGAARLVTITGPGGMGKTSLSLEVAAQLVDQFPGGLFFVPLAGVVDTDLVLGAIAEVLEVSQSPDEPLAQSVAVSLGSGPLLLVLDNLEQVLGAAATIADLLDRAPGLTILATSRAPLRVRAEHEHPLGSLALPDAPAGAEPSAAGAMTAPAVELFVTRSREVRPDWTMTEQDAPVVTEICRRLDGLPLALELAAARSALLDPAALLTRLDHQLGLLTSGPRDLPDRQRTLRATLDWSHDLLTPDQQRLLARLGAATAPVDLDTIEALALVGGVQRTAAIDPPGTVDTLGALVDNSLVRRVDRSDGARFHLLETVREYAAERLADSGDEAAVRQALATHLVGRLEADAARFDGPEAPAALARVEADYPDLRASMTWALAHGDVGTAARNAVALRLFWFTRGRLVEGREFLGSVLAELGPDDPARAGVLLAAGVFAYFQDDGDEAAANLTASLDAARRHDDVACEATALGYLGALDLGAGDAEAALAKAALARELADRHDLYESHALALSLCAVVAASRGELESERDLYRQRLDLARSHGDRRRIAETLNNLAEVALAEDDVAAARAYADEALELARNVARIVTRDVLLTRGRIAVGDADVELAMRRLSEAARLSIDLGQEFEVAQCLLGLAGAAGLVGDHARAAQLYGSAARLRGGGGPLDVELEPEVAAQRELVRSALGDAAFDAALAHGAALSRDEAVALALEQR